MSAINVPSGETNPDPMTLRDATAEERHVSGALQVRTGCISRTSTIAACRAAAREIVVQALDEDLIDRLPVRCALLLATADWCQPGVSLPRAVREEFKRRLGYQVPLVGGSMAKLFHLDKSNEFIEHGIVLALLYSYDLWVTVGWLDRPHEQTAAKRSEQIGGLTKRLEEEAQIRIGSSAARFLLGVFPGFFKDAGSELAYRDNELHEEVLGAFEHRYRLIGAAAADALEPTVGYQFANNECLQSGLALALVESDIATGTLLGHGLYADTDKCISVDMLQGDADIGYEVAMLDGKPAQERLAELQSEAVGGIQPVFLGAQKGSDFDISCVVSSKRRCDGSVRLNRAVRKGDRFRVLRTTADRLVETAHQTTEEAAKRSLVGTGNAGRAGDAAETIHGGQSPFNSLKLICDLTCTGRVALYNQFGRSWQETAECIKARFPAVPIIGGLCAGEFGVDGCLQSRANCFSFWVGCFTSSSSPRAATRELQTGLLQASSRLHECKTPEKVMEMALRAAIECGGASGGQICVVEQELIDGRYGKVLGKGHGYAMSAPTLFPDEQQNWQAVAEVTVRDAPAHLGGPFPRDLLDWSTEVRRLDNLRIVGSLSRKCEPDILTLITRTLRAVFVYDVMDEKFKCDAAAAKRGNVTTFLAVPLVGASGSATATMQIGFRPHHVLDRESLGLWVAYAQRVAGALELAQEMAEGQALEIITAKTTEIMRRRSNADNPTADEFDWCNEFLGTVKKVLGANGAHMRSRRKWRGRDEEYHLAGDVGFLADVRRKTRPVTTLKGHGSCSGRVFERKEWWANTELTVRDGNAKVSSINGLEPDRQKFEEQLRQVRSTAMVPISDHKLALGTLVVDHCQEYFFTRRRKRIVRAAAAAAGAILSERWAVLGAARMNKERSWILQALSQAGGVAAEASLQDIVNHMTREFQANVASLYIWHEACRKMVLHLAHNWHCGRALEGNACFAREEEWTGRLGWRGPAVQLLPPKAKAPPPRDKYREAMLGPELPVEDELRLGIRLGGGDPPIGLLTFLYHRPKGERFLEAREQDRVVDLAKGLAPVISLSVQAVRDDILQQRIKDLQQAAVQVAGEILMAARPGETWQSAMDLVRRQFRVERATYYEFRSKLMTCECSSRAPEAACGAVQQIEMLPPAEFNEIRAHPQLVLALNEEEIRGACCALWPNAKGVVLVPVIGRVPTTSEAHGVGRGQKVYGVLELVNRATDRDHPFPGFDTVDQLLASDIGRSLGAGIMVKEGNLTLSMCLKRNELATQIGAAALSSAVTMHHLSQPIARIHSASDWLKCHPDASPEERAERFSQIDAGVQEVGNRLQVLSARSVSEHRNVNLQTLLRQVFQLMNPQVPDGVVCNTCNDVAVEVCVNVHSIVEALMCLVSNGLEALGPEGSLSISSRHDPSLGRAIIQIENSGKLVTDEDIAKFWDFGFTTKTEGGRQHAGVGLKIALKAIEAAHGTIRMAPRPEGGVVASVFLPTLKAPD
jgi:signal transduction histidine kinase/GAF domain-containing protein